MQLRHAFISDIGIRPDGTPDNSLLQRIQEDTFEKEPDRLTALDGLAKEFPGLQGFAIDINPPGKQRGRLKPGDLGEIKEGVVSAIGVLQGHLGGEGGLIIPEQGKKGVFYAISHPIEKIFFDTDIDAVAYGAILMSNLGELRRFDEQSGRLRIAVAPQWAYETDDGSGLMSPEFAARMEIPQDRAFQFRLAGLFESESGRRGFVGKGTLRQALPGEDFPAGVDMVLTMDNLKGRKLGFFEPFRVGEPLENGTIIVEVPTGVVGIREFSRNNPIGLGDTILKTVPEIVITKEIQPRSERNLIAAEKALLSPRGVQELIEGDFKVPKDPIAAAYRRRLFALQGLNDKDHLVARRSYFEAEPSLLERFANLTDENGVNPLLGHDVIQREIVQSIGTIFRDAAEGSDVKFNSGMLFPLRTLNSGECLIPGEKAGEEIIVFRQPINGLRSIQVLRNVGADKAGNSELDGLKGVVFVYSNRPPEDYERLKKENPSDPVVLAFEAGQRNRAGAGWDFDGDFLGYMPARDFPLLARTIKASHSIIDRGIDPTYFGREREREFLNLAPEKQTPQMKEQFERRQRYRDLEMDDKYPKKAERQITNENMVGVALANFDNVVGLVTNQMNKFVDHAHQRVVRENVLRENESAFLKAFEDIGDRFLGEIESFDHDSTSIRGFAREVSGIAKRFADPEKGESEIRKFEEAVFKEASNYNDLRRRRAKPFEGDEANDFLDRIRDLAGDVLPKPIMPQNIEGYVEALIRTREFNIAMMLGGEVEKGVKFKKVCPINHQLIDRAKVVLKEMEAQRFERYGVDQIERYARKYQDLLFEGPGTELVSPNNSADVSPLSRLAKNVSARYAGLLERHEADVAKPRRVFESLMPKVAPEEAERLGPVVKGISEVYRKAAIRASKVSHPDPKVGAQRRKEIIGEALRDLRSFIDTFPEADRQSMASMMWGQMHSGKAVQRKLEINLYWGTPNGKDQFSQDVRRLNPESGQLVFSKYEELKEFNHNGSHKRFQEKHNGVSIVLPPGNGKGSDTERIFEQILSVVRKNDFTSVVIRTEGAASRGENEGSFERERVGRILESRLILEGVKTEGGKAERYSGQISKSEAGFELEILSSGEGPVSNGRQVFNLFARELFETFQQRERFPRKFVVTGVGRNDFSDWGEDQGWDGKPGNYQLFEVRQEVVGGEEKKGRREIRSVVEVLSQDGERQGRLGTISMAGKDVPTGIYRGIFWRETEHSYNPATRAMESKYGATLEVSEAQLIALPIDHLERSMRKPNPAEVRFPNSHITAHLVPASGWETEKGTAAKLAEMNPELMDAYIAERRTRRYLKAGDIQTVVTEVDDKQVILANIVAGMRSFDQETTIDELRRGIRLGAAGLSRLAVEGGAKSIEVVIDPRLTKIAPGIRREFGESFGKGSGLEVRFLIDDDQGPFIGEAAKGVRPIPNYGADALPPVAGSPKNAQTVEGKALVEFSKPESRDLKGDVLFVLAAPLGIDEKVQTGPLGIVGSRYPNVRETFGHWNSRLVPPRPGEILITTRDENSLIGIVVTGMNVEEDSRRAGLSAGVAGKSLGFREVRFLTDEAYPGISKGLIEGFRKGMTEAQTVEGVNFSEIPIPKGRAFEQRKGEPLPYQIIHGTGEMAPPPDRLLVVSLVGNGNLGAISGRAEKGFGRFLERHFPMVPMALRESREGLFLGAVQTVNEKGKTFEASGIVFANALVFGSPPPRSTENVRSNEGQFSEIALNLAFLGKGGIFELLQREKAANREMGLYVGPVIEMTRMKGERIQEQVDELLRFGQTEKGGRIKVIEPWRGDVLTKMVALKDGFQISRDERPIPMPLPAQGRLMAPQPIGR